MSGTSQSSDSMIPAIFFKFNDFFVCLNGLNDFFPELSVFTDTFLCFFCMVVCFSHYFLSLSIFLVLSWSKYGSTQTTNPNPQLVFGWNASFQISTIPKIAFVKAVATVEEVIVISDGSSQVGEVSQVIWSVSHSAKEDLLASPRLSNWQYITILWLFQ